MDHWNANLCSYDGDSVYGLCITLGTNVILSATVITGLFGAVPFIGDALQTLLLGGPAVDNATLNRFLVYIIIAFLDSWIVIVHIWAFILLEIIIQRVWKYEEGQRGGGKRYSSILALLHNKRCIRFSSYYGYFLCSCWLHAKLSWTP